VQTAQKRGQESAPEQKNYVINLYYAIARRGVDIQFALRGVLTCHQESIIRVELRGYQCQGAMGIEKRDYDSRRRFSLALIKSAMRAIIIEWVSNLAKHTALGARR